jgi:hypothetical protein
MTLALCRCPGSAVTTSVAGSQETRGPWSRRRKIWVKKRFTKYVFMAKTIAENIGIFWLKIWIVAQVFQENAFFAKNT